MSDSGEERRNRLRVSLFPLKAGSVARPICLGLGPYGSNSGEYVNLNVDEAVELAGWLLGTAALLHTGEGGRIAETLELKFEDLSRVLTTKLFNEPKGDEVPPTEEQMCSSCGKVIRNRANMARHLRGHHQ